MNKEMENKQSLDTKTLAIAAIFTALTYVFTAFVNVRLPIAANGGLIHLGNIPLFIGAIVFGSHVGAIAGGIGMGLFDLLSGWTSWAPFTLVIVGLMGYAVGKIAGKQNSMIRNIIALIVAGIIKVAGYYIAEIILFGSFVAPLSSIPGNIVQIAVAAVIVIPIAPLLKKAAVGIFHMA